MNNNSAITNYLGSDLDNWELFEQFELDVGNHLSEDIMEYVKQKYFRLYVKCILRHNIREIELAYSRDNHLLSKDSLRLIKKLKRHNYECCVDRSLLKKCIDELERYFCTFRKYKHDDIFLENPEYTTQTLKMLINVSKKYL